MRKRVHLLSLYFELLKNILNIIRIVKSNLSNNK